MGLPPGGRPDLRYIFFDIFDIFDIKRGGVHIDCILVILVILRHIKRGGVHIGHIKRGGVHIGHIGHIGHIKHIMSSIYPWAYTGENFCAPLASKIYPRRYPTDGSKGNG